MGYALQLIAQSAPQRLPPRPGTKHARHWAGSKSTGAVVSRAAHWFGATALHACIRGAGTLDDRAEMGVVDVGRGAANICWARPIASLLHTGPMWIATHFHPHIHAIHASKSSPARGNRCTLAERYKPCQSASSKLIPVDACMGTNRVSSPPSTVAHSPNHHAIPPSHQSTLMRWSGELDKV